MILDDVNLLNLDNNSFYMNSYFSNSTSQRPIIESEIQSFINQSKGRNSSINIGIVPNKGYDMKTTDYSNVGFNRNYSGNVGTNAATPLDLKNKQLNIITSGDVNLQTNNNNKLNITLLPKPVVPTTAPALNLTENADNETQKSLKPISDNSKSTVLSNSLNSQLSRNVRSFAADKDNKAMPEVKLLKIEKGFRVAKPIMPSKKG